MKRVVSIFLCCGLLLGFAGLVQAETAKAPMKTVNKGGEVEEIGFITFTDTPEGLLMEMDVFALPEGTHKVSLRNKPDCALKKHKEKGAAGTVATGDDAKGEKVKGVPCEPPDLTVGKDGKAKVQHVAPGVKVSDVRNHAVIISKKAKDAEGTRSKPVACGVIK